MTTSPSFRCPVRLSAAASQAGFSVVEILVALVAGLVLSAGVFQVFLASKQTYQVGDQVSRLQENSRLAIDNISRHARMAGSLGCTSQVVTKITSTLNLKDSLYYKFAVPLEGFEAKSTHPGESYKIADEYPGPSSSKSNWSPSIPNDISPALLGDVVEGTDVLVLRTRSGNSTFLSALTNDALTVGSLPANLAEGDIAIVADCALIRIFKVTAISEKGELSHAADPSGKPGNSCGTWNVASGPSPCRSYPFPTSATAGTGAPAEVSEVATELFFISRREASKTDPNPGPSLYYRYGNDPKIELVEGVENMQILYGITDDGGNVQFLPADSITNWATAKITSIRVGLLMRTVDYASPYTDTETYDLAGTTIDPVGDRRIRKAITATIGIRNQLH